MMKAKLLLMAGVLALAGCTDTMDSISREYRNANNEVIDAMMMITTEAKAKQMNTLIFKTLTQRYGKLKDKLKIYEINRASKFEWVQDVYESDGVHLYLAELRANQARFALEKRRLTKLRDQYVEEAQAKQDERVDEKTVAPILSEIVDHPGHPLVEFQKQLNKSELQTKMDAFKSFKITPEQWKSLQKTLDEKAAKFKKEAENKPE